MTKKNKDDLNNIILGGTSVPKDSVPPVTALDDDLTSILQMSQEEIEKLRQQKLDEIEKKILDLKSKVNKEDIESYVLENKIELLEKAKYMLNEFMVTVISQLSAQPKAFDVLSQMFTMVSDLNKSVLTKDGEQLNVKIENSQKQSENEILQNTTQLIGKIMEMNQNKQQSNVKFASK